jgi:hypothetical protein
MKKLAYIFFFLKLFIAPPESFGQSNPLEKNQILDSSYIDLSGLKYNNRKLISQIENDKPYSGKVYGSSFLWFGYPRNIASISHFGGIIYGWDEFGRPALDKKLFLIGQIKKGRETGIWYYYSEDKVLRAKAHFKKGLLNGKAEIYNENGTIDRTEKFKSGKLDGYVTIYDDHGNIFMKDMYKEGHIIETFVYHFASQTKIAIFEIEN